MLALHIKDKIRWQDRWSTEFGRKLRIQDSTDNLMIFGEECTRDEILAVLESVPESLYEILEVETASKGQCDYLADSGQCFDRKKV